MENFQNPAPVLPNPNFQQPVPQPPVQPTVQQPVQQTSPAFQPANQQSPPVETPKQNKDAVDKIVQIVYFSYFFVAAVLLFRFALSMFGANKSPFVDFVRQITSPFMFPFANMFGGPVGVSDYRLEFEAIIAVIVYGLVFFGLAKLIKIIFK